MSEPLYHGTDNSSKENIINNGINVNQNPKGGDFAVGFYLTPDLTSARNMALRKSYNNGSPSIVELTLNNDYKKAVSYKDFGVISSNSPEKDMLSWAQFIINNRCGKEYVESVSSVYGYGDNNLDKRYDIVIGSIADGSVSKLSRICKAEKRIVTLIEAKHLLDKTFGIQYCICTEKGLSVIKDMPREKKGVSWR